LLRVAVTLRLGHPSSAGSGGSACSRPQVANTWP